MVDDGKSEPTIMEERSGIRTKLCLMEKKYLSNIPQKSKIRSWSIEVDENSKYYHRFLKKKKRQLQKQGIKVDGYWSIKFHLVKKVFLNTFKKKFKKNTVIHIVSRNNRLKELLEEQAHSLEVPCTLEEVKQCDVMVVKKLEG